MIATSEVIKPSRVLAIAGFTQSAADLCAVVATRGADTGAFELSVIRDRPVELLLSSEPRATLVVADFPIGIPVAFAKAAQISSFRQLLSDVESGRRPAFFQPQPKPSTQHPFSTASLRDIAAALGVAPTELHRECDRATVNRNHAESTFCVRHVKRVGRSAIQGWAELLQPYFLTSKLWPFDGTLSALLPTRGLIISELFAAEAVTLLKLELGRGFGRNKHSRADRVAVMDSLLRQVEACGLDRHARELVAAAVPASEFEFDAAVMLVATLQIIEGILPVSEPDADAVRQIEGWSLGQQYPSPLRTPVPRAHFLAQSTTSNERFFVDRIRWKSEGSETTLQLAYPTDTTRGAINILCGINNSGKSFLLDQLRRRLDGRPYNPSIHVEPLPSGHPKLLFIGKGWFAKDEVGEVNLAQTLEALSVPVHLGDYRRIGLSMLASQLAYYLEDVDPHDAVVRLEEPHIRQAIADTFEVEGTAYRCNPEDPLIARLERILQGRLYFRCTRHVETASTWTFEFVLVDEVGTTIPFKKWSDGQRVCFYVLSALAHLRPDVVLFDEMENHLHPAYMSELLDALRTHPAQSIIATHHPHLIFSRYADRVFYIETQRPPPSRNPPREIAYSKRHTDRGFPRTVSVIEDDLERIGSAYKLFSQVDEQLLRQAGYLESRAAVALLESINSLFAHGPVAEAARTLPDTQTYQLADRIRAIAKLDRPQQVAVLDLGAGIGRQIAELGKLSRWQVDATVSWTCYEPSSKSLATLRRRFEDVSEVTVVGAASELGDTEFDLCVLANVLHELTPRDAATLLALADQHLPRQRGALVVLELFPLLNPEGYAVPYEAASLQDILTNAGFVASTLEIGVRSESRAYCLTARRREGRVQESAILSAIEAGWEQILRRSLSAYAAIGDAGPVSIAEHIRTLSHLTTVMSINSWKAGMWRSLQESSGPD